MEYLSDGSIQAPNKSKKILGMLYLDKKRDVISPESINKMLLFMQKCEEGVLDFNFQRLPQSGSRISEGYFQSRKTCLGGTIHIETEVILFDPGVAKYTYKTKLQLRISEQGASKLLVFEYSDNEGAKRKLTLLY